MNSFCCLFTGRKFYVCITGKTLNSHNGFIDRLRKLIHLQEVDSVEESDFILGFCPIVSQAGTDIEAAVKKLQNVSGSHKILIFFNNTLYMLNYVVNKCLVCFFNLFFFQTPNLLF